MIADHLIVIDIKLSTVLLFLIYYTGHQWWSRRKYEQSMIKHRAAMKEMGEKSKRDIEAIYAQREDDEL